MRKLLYLLGLLVFSNWAFGQDFSKPDPIYSTVTLDLPNYSTKDLGLLPFDDAVLFIPTFSDDVKKDMNLKKGDPIYLFVKKGRCFPYEKLVQFELKGQGIYLPNNKYGLPTQTYIYFGEEVGTDEVKEKTPYHFEPNKRYCIQITDNKDKANDLTYTQSARINAHTASSFSNVVKLDIGAAYVPSVNSTFGVVSAHLYFSPINDDADIKITSPESCNKWFWKRFSVFACSAPFTAFSGAKQEIKPVANLGNFGFGFGWRSPFYGYRKLVTGNRVYQMGRILQPIRLNFGVLHYAMANPNPVIDQTVSKWSFMASLTYSFGISALLGPLAKLFG